ncbi:MAG TPA: septation protein SepH [Acidimicrobiales bacterium]|nr:septation protein SepH [Acidimicrobiales bacterium]
MRQLHVIGFTSDHRGLILATKRDAERGGYVLQIDDAVLHDLQRSHPGHADRSGPGRKPGSGLTPREIQARLRAGRTVEEVAYEAGVSTDWVDRFAGPVLAEQAAAVARAWQATLHPPGQGASERPLEGAVMHRLADRGVALTADELAEGWSAYHLVDRNWVIRFRFRAKGREQSAEWALDLTTGYLTARNRLGAELGYVGPEIRAQVTDGGEDRSGPTAGRRGRGPERAATAPSRRAVGAMRGPAGREASPEPAAPAAVVAPAAPDLEGAVDRDQPPGADQLTLPSPADQPVVWEAGHPPLSGPAGDDPDLAPASPAARRPGREA